MGRSRPPIAAEDEPGSFGNRSKRRRIALGGDNLEAGVSGSSDGKKALYHCNYCNKDISGNIRIKCAKCPDFDLCVECFSVGVEVTPHKCNHPYRVIDNLSFPLIHPDWNADEEILLLEGVETYGLGNWAEVAENVATKTKTQCYEHYMAAYMNSLCSPLPDMTHVHGKSKAELLAMAKTQLEGKKAAVGEGVVLKPPKQEPSVSPARIKVEERDATGGGGRSPSTFITGTVTEGEDGDGKLLGDKAAAVSNASADVAQSNRSIGVKKPKPLLEDNKAGITVLDQSGFNSKRQEFDPEYDNEAELPLAEMEFKDNDTETDRELKIRMLHIYLSRLVERKRRKEFILERGLLDVKRQQALEKKRSKEERELYQRAQVFLRYHSLEEHEALLTGLITERRIRQRIAELQECRAAGCRTIAEAEQYKMEKKKREEATMQKNREDTAYTSAGKATQRSNRTVSKENIDGEVDLSSDLTESQKAGMFSTTTSATGKGMNKPVSTWDLTGLPGSDLLTLTEQKLCTQSRILPAHYLKIKEVLMLECLKTGQVKRLDAHRLFKLDVSKIDKVYDFLLQLGWIQGERTLLLREEEE